MSEQDSDGQAPDPRAAGGGDPRQGVHGSGGYGDPAQDAETSVDDPGGASDGPSAGAGEDAEAEASVAEQERGQIGGA